MTKMMYRVGLLTLIIVLAPLGNFIADGWTMDKKAYESIYIDQFVKIMVPIQGVQ